MIQAKDLKRGDVIRPFGRVVRVVSNGRGVDVQFRTGQRRSYLGLVEVHERGEAAATGAATAAVDQGRA
jgi:hypothetical protein